MKLFSAKYIGDLKSLHNRKDRPRGFGGKIKGIKKKSGLELSELSKTENLTSSSI